MKDMTYEEWLELDEIVIPLKPDLWREMEDISLAYAIMVSNNLDPNGYFELKNSCTDWGGSPPQQYYPAWFSERLAVMESAIRTGTLKRTVTDKDHFGNNTVNTRIEMAGFLAWCNGKGYELYASASTDAVPATTPTDETIPGKLPNTTIGKLAVRAAFEIESKTGKRATATGVIARLQEWVNSDDYPELLEKISHGVKWATLKGKENCYDIGTCEKTLETWNKSRA